MSDFDPDDYADLKRQAEHMIAQANAEHFATLEYHAKKVGLELEDPCHGESGDWNVVLYYSKRAMRDTVEWLAVYLKGQWKLEGCVRFILVNRCILEAYQLGKADYPHPDDYKLTLECVVDKGHVRLDAPMCLSTERLHHQGYFRSRYEPMDLVSLDGAIYQHIGVRTGRMSAATPNLSSLPQRGVVLKNRGETFGSALSEEDKARVEQHVIAGVTKRLQDEMQRRVQSVMFAVECKAPPQALKISLA